MATKKTTDEIQDNTAPEKFPEPTLQDNIDRMNETVTIKLFKDSDRYKYDVVVRVDGKRYQLKRGIPVQVPRKVYDVVQQQLMQDQETAQLIERREVESESKLKALE